MFRICLKTRPPLLSIAKPLIIKRPAIRYFASLPDKFEKLKQRYKEDVFNIPNSLTISRILMTPAIGLCILNHNYKSGIALLCVAAFTDALDGYIARNYNMQTALGSILDPLADKVLMTTLVVSLTKIGHLPSI